jgi:Ser/Thr protein kinase RdoA (MazF antagonist)
MPTRSDEVRRVICAINAQLGASYELVERFDTGEWGAFQIRDLVGAVFVLKFVLDPEKSNIVDATPEQSMRLNQRLLSLGYPVPEFYHVDYLPHRGRYWVMQKLPGKPLWQDPTVTQVEQMLTFLNLQKNQAVSKEQNLSQFARDIVFSGRYERRRDRISAYSPETRAFLGRLLDAVKDLEELDLSETDIVHGDFSYHQLMVQDGGITGVIDWQEAGCGDWLIDLTRLVYSLHDRPRLAKPITRVIKEQDMQKIRLFTVFTAIEMLWWPLETQPNSIGAALNKAKSAFEFVFSRRCRY